MKNYFCLSANDKQEILRSEITKVLGSEETNFLNCYQLDADYVVGVLQKLGYKLLNVTSVSQDYSVEHYFHFIPDDSHDKRN